jgi:hypothetical protein
MTQEALKLALEALGNSWTEPGTLQYEIEQEAITAIKEALAQTEQEPVANIQFMRQVLSVAIAGLYEHYKDDVLRVFTLDELQTVIDLSESFRLQQVEDIYKRAWDMLASTIPPQRTWVGLTNDELTDLFYNTNLGQASAVAQAIALLKEKNT